MNQCNPDEQLYLFYLHESCVWRSRPFGPTDPKLSRDDENPLTAFKEGLSAPDETMDKMVSHIKNCIREHKDFVATPSLLRSLYENNYAGSTTLYDWFRTLKPRQCSVIGIPNPIERGPSLPPSHRLAGQSFKNG